MVRLRVLTADKRMPPEDASAGSGETLRRGMKEEKAREENPQHKSNALAREVFIVKLVRILHEFH